METLARLLEKCTCAGSQTLAYRFSGFTLHHQGSCHRTQDSGCLHKDSTQPPSHVSRGESWSLLWLPGCGWVALWLRQKAKVVNNDAIKVRYYVRDT